jgi:tetratricopeptide (TPR) repeat protein
MESFSTRPWRFAALHRGLGLASWLVVLALGLMLGNHTLSDQDLFLHDLAGRRILAGEGIPHQNEFSFTAPQHPWVDHEWLFQVVVALVGNAGGEDLAARATTWHALTLLLTGALLAVLLVGDGLATRLRAGSAPSPWLMLAALLTLAMLWTRLLLRPELVSMVLFVIVLRQVEAAYRAPGDGAPATTGWRDLADPRRAAGRATLTTVAWAQVHGFYLLSAFIWLAVGLTGSHDRRLRPGARALAFAGAGAAILAGLLTPNHINGLLYPLRVLGQFTGSGPDLRRTISELVPLLQTQNGLHLTIAAYLSSLFWGAAWVVATWGRVPRGRIVLWALAALAAWQGQRNLGLYAITFLLLHTGLRPGEIWLVRRYGRMAVRWPRAAGVVAAVLVLVVGAFWAREIASSRFYLREGETRRWGRGFTPALFPLRQAAALPGGLRLANNIDAASTLLRLGAGKVCIDGRTEAYPAAAWREYATVKAGGDDALAMLGRWQVQRIVLAHRNQASHPLLGTLLRSPAWALADADDAGVLFVPAGTGDAAPPAELLRRSAAAFTAQLPAAGRRDVRAADRCAALATLLNLADDGGSARGLLERARSLCPDHPEVLHNLANQLMAAGEIPAAAALFRQAAALNPRAAGSFLNAGVCEFRQGRTDEAARLVARATRISPRLFEAWANLAEMRRASGELSGARHAYAKALALRDDPRLRARAAELQR